jgi:membrane-bound lytic murein transglycosylase F
MNTRFDSLIKSAVEKHLPGYDWRLYKAQLWEESKLNPRAVSPAGAGGLAQFMPDTWIQWGPRAGFNEEDRFDPEASIFTGACYMAWLRDEWSWARPEVDRHCLMLASYNSGLGDILEAQKVSGMKSLYGDIIEKLPEVEPDHAAEPIRYVKRIMAYWIDHIVQGEYEAR